MEASTATLSEVLATVPEAAFPLKFAALDVGSNAIRYTIAEFNDRAHFTELENQRFAVRLGHDAFTSGRLEGDAIQGARESALAFRQRLDDLGISHYRAVATSAVRDSRNGAELVDAVRGESGIHLETISGSEEARLVWLATQHVVKFDRRPWILADLGGGSVEVSIVSDQGIHWSQSHPIGTVRLVEDIAPGVEDLREFRHLIERYMKRLTLPEGSESEIEGIVITGGNAEALADLAGAGLNEEGVTEMTRGDLRNVLERLAEMTFRERVDDLGLREDRADVIVPAAIIFDRVAEIADAERILVPRVGVKEGVLLDLAFDYAEHNAHESEMDNLARAAAIALGRRYRFDEPHGRKVAEHAVSLFDQLQKEHGLGEKSRRRLETGALLHDIGQFISYRKHHKHSFYLVTNSDLSALSNRDIRIVALLTRYHRRSEPKEEHEEYMDLSGDEKEEVKRLSAILRIADALDREHRGRVDEVRIKVKKGRATLKISRHDDILLEEWALKRKSSFFEKVYGLKLRVD